MPPFDSREAHRACSHFETLALGGCTRWCCGRLPRHHRCGHGRRRGTPGRKRTGRLRHLDEPAGGRRGLQRAPAELLRRPPVPLPWQPSNSCGTYSCLWPFTNATAGTVVPLRHPERCSLLLRRRRPPDRSRPLPRLVGGLSLRYGPPPAYQSAVAPPLGPGGATYYDDNAWVGLNLIHAYLLTSKRNYLTLAQSELNFIISGWDTNTSDGCREASSGRTLPAASATPPRTAPAQSSRSNSTGSPGTPRT